MKKETLEKLRIDSQANIAKTLNKEQTTWLYCLVIIHSINNHSVKLASTQNRHIADFYTQPHKKYLIKPITYQDLIYAIFVLRTYFNKEENHGRK